MRGEGYSLADIGAVVRNNTNNGGFGDFGNNGDWAWIIILFLIFGIGRNGYGGFGGGSGIGENYVLATDFATIERKLDSVNAGLCDGFYAQNTNMLNGFNGLQNTLCQGFSGVNLAITNNGYATQSAINDLSGQLAKCCCGLEKSLLENRYLDAQNTCAITNAIAMNTRDLLENANANYRAIHEELVANKLEMKNDRIAEQQNEINALRLRASQEAQNNYLISQLKPCPDPAYIVPNPNCCYQYTVAQNGCGCNQYL